MIFRGFESRDPKFLVKLFAVYVRPMLEYASPVWSPHLKKDVALIERVQRLFTKRIPAVRHLPYTDRLSILGMRSLEHRRLYLDLVYLYKIIHGLCVLNIANLGISAVCSRQSLRNYGFHLGTAFSSSSLQQYSFAERTCRLWNKLPKNSYCMSLSSFKKCIDKIDLVSLHLNVF
jgi:hypothetical protein